MRRVSEKLAVLAFVVLLVGCREAPVAAVYSIKDYDPKRDPAADLAATVKLAQVENKRILLQVGGKWCGWCHRLDKYIATHPAVARVLAAKFIIMKVNYSDENKNAEFLAQFPKVGGYPHWFFLDSDGKFLHSQGTGELEEGDNYIEPKMLIVLRTWRAGGLSASNQ